MAVMRPMIKPLFHSMAEILKTEMRDTIKITSAAIPNRMASEPIALVTTALVEFSKKFPASKDCSWQRIFIRGILSPQKHDARNK